MPTDILGGHFFNKYIDFRTVVLYNESIIDL